MIYFVMGEVQLFKVAQLKKVGRDTGEIVVTEVNFFHLKEGKQNLFCVDNVIDTRISKKKVCHCILRLGELQRL